MSIHIRPLMPEDAETFADFFAGPNFGHAPHWSGCYCRFYHADLPDEKWMARTGEENRAEAIAEIKAGRMKGYLAFDNDTVIGWCNANDATSYIRVAEDITPYMTEGKFGATMCFVIHPDYRGQGVARQMLKQITEAFKSKGYVGMLALPFESKDSPEKRYRGTKRMYEELGYQQIDEDDGVYVMKLIF